ncbi:MAG: M48 family metalloprotease [Candidatus Wallbacteria bacterium]|nr:M48 family metalloprotease [Candidatus Wallbacteria bacterium]
MFSVLVFSDSVAAKKITGEDFVKALVLLKTAQVWNVSSAEEKRIGDRVYQEITKHYKVWDNAKKSQWASDIFSRVSSHAHRQKSGEIIYSLTIVREKSINALALPGGHIILFSGLVEKIRSDDELACIIGHEITHVEKKHSLQLMKTDSLLASLIMLGAQSGQAGSGLTAIRQVAMMQYSRTDEEEADAGGALLASGAGYNAYAMVDFLEMLMKLEGPDQDEWSAILRSHPVSGQRAQELIWKTEENPELYRKGQMLNLSYAEGVLLTADPYNMIPDPEFSDRRFTSSGLKLQKSMQGSIEVTSGLVGTAANFNLFSLPFGLDMEHEFRFELIATPVAPSTLEIVFRFFDQDKERLFPDQKSCKTVRCYRTRVLEEIHPGRIPPDTAMIQVLISGACPNPGALILEWWNFTPWKRLEIRRDFLHKAPQFRIEGLEKLSIQ